jgi:hypothetical protein
MNLLIAAMLSLVVRSTPTDKLVLHEWGTFTSVAGADGKPIEWNSLAGPSDLPSFVYTIEKSSLGLRVPEQNTKHTLQGTVRMETPVIYFYADKETEVSLKVDFPNGIITEWYPFAKEFEGHSLNWGRFKVQPKTSPELPTEGAPSHYYPARDVDASPIQICGEDQTGKPKIEHEKFLFYRGVGDFQLPLNATVRNNSIELKGFKGDVLLFERNGNQIGIRLANGSTLLERPVLTSKIEDAHEAILKLLLTTGLYEKEAKAMLATWKDTWFEDGLRALYIIPTATTNQLLPLTVSPTPTETVRVLVGRMELLTNERVVSFRKELMLPKSKLDPKALRLKFGTFSEPLLKRAILSAESKKEQKQLASVLESLTAQVIGEPTFSRTGTVQ